MLLEKFLILRNIERDIIVNERRSLCKARVILLMKRIFSMNSAKIFKYQNSCKFAVGSELFHADLQTDMTDLTVA